MSPMALLLVLLVLAYIGSLWAASGRKRAFGSPSGIEYVVLGALLGPEALGVLGQQALVTFEPVAIVALGWIGLIFGLECGLVAGRRAPLHRMALGLTFTAITAGATFYASFRLLDWMNLHDASTRIVLCGAVALVSVETARHAVQWIGEEALLSGSLAGLLLDLEAADDIPVLLALSALFAYVAGDHELYGQAISPWALGAGTLVAGAVLGAPCAWLMDRAGSKAERWTVLLGAAWLTTGIAKSLGLSAVASTFAFGASLATFTREREVLRLSLGRTEGAVLLPALLLTGAQLRHPVGPGELLLIALAIGLRLLLSLAFGVALSLKRPETRGLGLWLGAGMLSPGSLTMVVGFALSMRCPPEVARPALAVAALGTLLGELVGPRALREVIGRFNVEPRPSREPAVEAHKGEGPA
jgi:Kef-type K+ transport system membrane component KefB